MRFSFLQQAVLCSKNTSSLNNLDENLCRFLVFQQRRLFKTTGIPVQASAQARAPYILAHFCKKQGSLAFTQFRLQRKRGKKNSGSILSQICHASDGTDHHPPNKSAKHTRPFAIDQKTELASLLFHLLLSNDISSPLRHQNVTCTNVTLR